MAVEQNQLKQALQVVGDCYTKINEVVSLSTFSGLGKQEAMDAIKTEHKELEKKLNELL